MQMNFNLNDMVAVQLTPAGVAQLNKFWDNAFASTLEAIHPERREAMKKEMVPYYTKHKEIPADGWKEFSFYELMHIFGSSFSSFYYDPKTHPFVDSNIRFLGNKQVAA